MVAGANVHDTKLLEATLAAIVVERPQPTDQAPQHLCLDKGYDNPTGHQAAAAHDQAHIRRIGEEKLDSFGEKTHPARRWVSWLSKCRGLLVRYEGIQFLFCNWLTGYRRVWRLTVLRSYLVLPVVPTPIWIVNAGGAASSMSSRVTVFVTAKANPDPSACLLSLANC